jgi:hypothetical protein
MRGENRQCTYITMTGGYYGLTGKGHDWSTALLGVMIFDGNGAERVLLIHAGQRPHVCIGLVRSLDIYKNTYLF